MVSFSAHAHLYTHTPRARKMSGSEPIILSDLLFSKIPGSPRRKSIPLFVELTPSQLHIFEAVATKSDGGAAGTSSSSIASSWSSDNQEFKKGKQVRTLWRDHEEDIKNVRKLDRPGRRSRMHKFYIQRSADGLYKFKCTHKECRDRWVKELTTASTTVCDFAAPPLGAEQATALILDDIGHEVAVPSVSQTYYYTAPTQSHLQPWLEPVRSEGESRHYPLKRQPSTDSDFPRSRSPSIGDALSESGYSSSDHELGNGAGSSRSASLKRMPDWEQSQPTSPTDATNKTFTMPLKVSRVPTKFADHEEKLEDNALVQLSELRHLTQHLSLDSLAENNLKSLSPVPEENEPAEFENDPDLEVVYLLQESLEYQIGRDGTTISLLEDLGIIIDVPRGAIPDDHPDDVTLKINACISGPFELPDGFELASPVYHIEPGVKFAEKPVELSVVHFIDIEDEEQCSELTFVTAPLNQGCQSEDEVEGKEIRFKHLDGGVFVPGRRMGKIALQHFCLIGIAQVKRKKEKVTPDTVDSSSIIRPKPAIPTTGKAAYTALLYSPVSFPEQLPRTYHVIFSISLSHPMFIKNLEKQLAKRFSIDSEFWRTSCKVNYAGDTIELDIPRDTLRELYGCEVHTDLGCVISKQNVDDIRRSRFSRSDYASYIDYPPRILLRIHQTCGHLSTPNRSSRDERQMAPDPHPQLKLIGTVEERCFNVPLPAHDTSQLPLSPQHSQLGTGSRPATPAIGCPNRRSLVSLPKQPASIHSVPNLKELGEKVTPHLFPKWYHIGIQLGLPPVTLAGIERQYQNDIRRCMNEVFYEWISRSEENPTWMTLIDTLRADSISERTLASELERTLNFD